MSTRHTGDQRFVELLKRWIYGDLKAKEESEMQQMTAKDAFQREALEGLNDVPEADHAAHMEALKSRLQQRIGTEIRPRLWPRLLALAAVLIGLLAGAILFFPNRNEQAPLASKEAEKRDTLPAPETEAVASTAEEENTMPAPSSGARSAAGNMMQKPAASNKDMAPAGPMLRVEEEAADVAVLTEEKQTVAKPIASAPAPDIFAKEKTSAPAAAKAMKTDSVSNIVAINPLGGWDAFNKMMQDSARLSTAARGNNVSGYVGLEFVPDPISGAPTQIRVVHSLGFGCDEEAIRLLGKTRWETDSSGRKSVVRIWFRK